MTAHRVDSKVCIRAKNPRYGFGFCSAFRGWLLERSGAGKVAGIEKEAHEAMPQCKARLPPKHAVCTDQDLARPLLDRPGANVCATPALAQARGPLPMLVSGAVRRRGAEGAVREAAR